MRRAEVMDVPARRVGAKLERSRAARPGGVAQPPPDAPAILGMQEAQLFPERQAGFGRSGAEPVLEQQVVAGVPAPYGHAGGVANLAQSLRRGLCSAAWLPRQPALPAPHRFLDLCREI